VGYGILYSSLPVVSNQGPRPDYFMNEVVCGGDVVGGKALQDRNIASSVTAVFWIRCGRLIDRRASQLISTAAKTLNKSKFLLSKN
jgi:hypothetical protein